MKKTLSLLLAAVLLLALFGCAKPKTDAPAANAPAAAPAPAADAPAADAPAAPADASSNEDALLAKYPTMGDLYDDATLDRQQECTSLCKHIVGFVSDGTYYRAIATLTQEQEDAIFAIDIFDEQSDEKQLAILRPIAIDRIENLTALMPSEEELKTLVGKTYGELMEEGWSSMGWNLYDGEFYFEKGLFAYTMTFDGTFTASDDFDPETAMVDCKVRSAVCTGIGDAGYLEE